MNLMKIIIAHYVKQFKFSTSLRYEHIGLKAGITLKLIGNKMVQIRNRM